MKTNVSEIQIVPIKPKNGLLAFANFVLDNKLFLSSVGIHQKINGDGYRLIYTTKKAGEKGINLFHPISKAVSKDIEDAVFEKFKDVMTKFNDRYYCAHDRFS